MRIALITLALTALVFIGSIIYSLAWQSWKLTLPTTTKQPIEDQLDVRSFEYQIKNSEKIDELTKKIDALTTPQAWIIVDPEKIEPKVSTGKVVLPLSWKFLARVMPAIEFTVVSNSGIYDLYIFDTSLDYSTYLDAKQAIKAIAIPVKYDIFIKNMKAIPDDAYTINEVKTFPFRWFYVNPIKPDTIIRLVIEVEWQVIALEIPKTRFDSFKKMLLKK